MDIFLVLQIVITVRQKHKGALGLRFVETQRGIEYLGDKQDEEDEGRRDRRDRNGRKKREKK